MFPANAEGRAAIIASLARRAYPTYEFFIFAILCGAVLGLGFLLDSPPVLLFGILLAPLMTPWVGMVLAMISGSVRFFVETLVAILITALLVFLSGMLSGFASRAFGPMTFNSGFFHSQLWAAWLVVLALGSVLLVVSFIRSEEKPFLPSVVLAYSLFTPVSAAGFGMGSGIEGMWPNGILVFAAHLALATLVGLITFLVMRFRPTTAGYLLSGVSTAAIAAVLILLMAPGLIGQGPKAEIPATQTPEVEPSAELVEAVASKTAAPTRSSATPQVRTATAVTLSPVQLMPGITLPPSETPTVTLTIEPTPVYARISSDTGGGVNLRKTPNGTYIATLDNGSIVEVLPEVEELSNTPWAHVIATRNGVRLEGWILQSVLVTATPLANWQPSATVTGTITGTAAP
jgi:hypothetical protein